MILSRPSVRFVPRIAVSQSHIGPEGFTPEAQVVTLRRLREILRFHHLAVSTRLYGDADIVLLASPTAEYIL